jgi:cytochrome P450
MFKMKEARKKGIKTTLVRANFISLFHRRSLPPGDMTIGLDELEAANRLSLIETSEEIGPIFKGRAWDSFWIYVVGLPRCREIMRQNESDMQPVTIDTTPLFAKGLLRQMEGDDHRVYRSQLGLALKSMDFSKTFNELAKDTVRELAILATEFGETPIPFKDLHQCFAGLVFDAFTRCVFGVDPQSGTGAELREAYHELGGNGLVWTPGVRQKKALATITDILNNIPADQPARDKDSLIDRMRAQGPIDEVMLGNLIYMVEMGRYDTTAFLRWLSWFAAMNPDWTDRIAEEEDSTQISEAFVMEALRLEQSERLVRRVKRDFVSNGFLFPKGAMVRFCIWESHKLPDAHDRPFDFDPGRFLNDSPGPDRYSPFGADKHQCPFGTFSIKFGAAFVKSMAKEYRLSSNGSRSSVRGLYHWEPEETFSPILLPRRVQASS